MAEPDIKILFNLEGGTSIDEGSGGRIAEDLTKIANKISNSDSKRPRITVSLDIAKTTSDFQTQLNSIIDNIKTNPVKIAVDTTQFGGTGSSLSGLDLSKLTNLQKQKLAEKELLAQEKLRAQQELNNISIKAAADAAEEKRNKKKQSEARANAKEMLSLQTQVNKATNDFDINQSFEQASNAIKGLNGNANELSEKLNKVKSDFANVQADIKGLMTSPDGSGLKSVSDLDQTDLATLKEYLNLLKQVQTDKQNLETSIKTSKTEKSSDSSIHKDTMALKNLIIQMEKFNAVNDRFRGNKQLSAQFDDIINQAKIADSMGDLAQADKLTAKYKTLLNQINQVGLTGQTFASKLGAQMSKLGVYFSAATVMMGAWRQVTNTIKDVIELDKAVTNLQIATGKTRDETKELLNTYSELGKELGATTIDVAEAGDDWLRQGKSIATTNKLIKDSMMLSKLGKIDTSEATTALTTMSKAYGVLDQDMTTIVDKLTAVDAVSATTAGGLAKSFQETAVSARLAGISIDRMAGYIAVVSEISGDAPESVGNFYKSFFSRMSSIKEGRMIDPDTGEDLSTVETILDNIGIKLRDTNKQFRNFEHVLDETAVKWKEMEASGDTVGQAKIASALGLTRQQEKAKILFENYDTALKYADIAANSLGTAEEKFNNAYLTSTEASMEAFTAQFEQFSNTVWNSDLFKGTFDTGTGLLGGLTWLVDTLGTIPVLAATAAGAMSAMTNKGWLTIVERQIFNIKYAQPLLEFVFIQTIVDHVLKYEESAVGIDYPMAG